MLLEEIFLEENFFWSVFEKTGNVESYLGYREICDYEGALKNDDQGKGTDSEGE